MSLSRSSKSQGYLTKPGKIVIRQYGDMWGFIYQGELHLFYGEWDAMERARRLIAIFARKRMPTHA